MASSTGWKILDLDQNHVPKLLVNSHFDKSGYAIKLTDLSRVWSESLSKDEIVQRATESGSSIDLDEDEEQFGIFEGKIESALNGEDGTSLSLRQDDGRNILLSLEAPLPHPLPPFKWQVKLQGQPQEHIEAEIVSPLIHQAAKLQTQIRSLVSELHDKDRVISKICDRLETSGNDLTTVFPGVSNIKTSRKKGQREQLARHVKGLTDFDEDLWRRRVGRGDANEVAASHRINEVFQGLPSSQDNLKLQSSSLWWEQLDNTSQANDTAKTRPEGHRDQSLTNSTSLQLEESMQEDVFQRQSTPPAVQRQSPEDDQDDQIDGADGLVGDDQNHAEPTVRVGDASTTEDEDDLDAPLRTSQPPRKEQRLPARRVDTPPVASPKKLGTIGGRSPKPPESPLKERTPERTIAKPKAKLGMIGGKAKPRETTPVEPVNHAPASPQAAKASKVDMIGGKTARHVTPLAKPVDNIPASRSPQEENARASRQSTKEPTPQPRETSQERADKKRDRLKRELEEKAKVPVKKKRKF